MLPVVLVLLAPALTSRAPPGTPVISICEHRGVLESGSTGLRYQMLDPGKGPQPKSRDAVRVVYEARLADGRIVDAPRGPVGLRVSGVIPGLTMALLSMCEGGRYRVWIPPDLAYGARGSSDGSVPPNAELVFTITLLKVGREAPPPAH
jgi:FKBP-type peptidyl-prolyl cis-trans isomerase FkpA